MVYMKFFILLLSLVPVLAHADSLGIDLGFGQNTRPFYGLDYQISDGLTYIDVSLAGNSDYVQPSISLGLQFSCINLGFATSLSIADYSDMQFGIGPEIGFTYNLSPLVFVKEGNNYTGLNKNFNFTSSFSIGLNL